MQNILTDEKNSRLNDLHDEGKRKVKHGNIDFDVYMKFLDLVINHRALRKDPVASMVKSEVFTCFTKNSAIVAANALQLDGFAINLKDDDKIDLILRIIRGQGERTHGTFSDVSRMRKGTVKLNIPVSWKICSNKISDVTIDENLETYKLAAWPNDWLPKIEKLAFLANSHLKAKQYILMKNGTFFPY